MDKGLSLYLDVLRFAAALTVLLSHATAARYTTAFSGAFGPFGHDAVIVFFVLSGYVIAFSAAHKDKSLGQYCVSRGARIYSVVVAAIVLTFVVDAIGMHLAPGLYRPHYQFDKLWFYIPFYSVFATDFWFFNERMLSNGPFWSLSYEVWYYVLFATFTYLTGRRRMFWALAVLLLIGPRQWLLFPIWLLGCWLYGNSDKFPLSKRSARLLFWGSIAAYGVLKGTGTISSINEMVNVHLNGLPKADLRYSQFFMGDYLIALLVGLNLHAARYCGFSLLKRWPRAIRWPASLTFSLYLFHMPLLLFYTALLGLSNRSIGDFVLLLACVLTTVALLGSVTERKKHVLKRILRQAAGKVQPALRSVLPV